jgi:type IV pilus assembly protein PilC
VAKRKLFAKRVTPKDLMNFSRQLSAFIRAGIPILEAFDLLREDAANPTLRAAPRGDVGVAACGRGSFEALDRNPHVFPVGYRSMLRSAELTGNLDGVLDRLAHYLERDQEAKGKIRSALVYPCVVAVMSVGVVTLLVVFVLPKFKVFFTSFDRELPAPTRALLWISQFLSTWYWALLAGLVLAVIGGVFALRNERIRGHVDRRLLHVPAIGPTIRFAIVERFARVLGAMLQAGVTLPEAMDVAAAGTNNRFVRSTLTAARDAMMRGEGIADPLASSGLFPAAATQMLRVASAPATSTSSSTPSQRSTSGSSTTASSDSRRSSSRPAHLMGIVVGFVALALVSAMYGIYRTGTP